MLIYIIIFYLSILSTYIAEKNIKNKPAFVFFSTIAVLFPSLLAGFRDSGIGTDTLIYVDNIWHNIQYIHNWHNFVYAYQQRMFDDIEIGYLFLNWLASWFGQDVHLIYFLANFVVIILIYLTAYNYRKKIPMWLMMSLFLFLYYSLSLNLVRQSIALATGLYSFKFLEQRNWVKLSIWCIMTLIAHNTGIFFLTFIGFYWLYFQIDTPIERRIFLCVTFICIILLFWYLQQIILLFVSWGVIPAKFLFYMSNENTGQGGRSALVLNAILFLILWYIKMFIYKKNYNTQQRELVNFACSAKLISLLLLALTFVSFWCYRAAYYFSFITDLILFPIAIQLIKLRNKSIHRLLWIFIQLFIIFMWYWLIVYKGENEIIPYKSTLLNL